MDTNSLAPLYGKVYGSLYFSVLITTGLYGVSCMQTFYYYVHYPDDPLRMKSFVAALWALDTIHEALTVAGVYKYIIAGIGDPLAILLGIPELAILSVAVVAIPVQAYFVHRFYVFGKREFRSASKKIIVIPLIWAILAIYQLVAAILYVARMLYSVDGSIHVSGIFVLTDNFFSSLTISTLTIAATVDVLIAIGTTFLLLRCDTEFRRTAHTLQRLVMLAINTGIWTATFAVWALILIRALPATLLQTLFTIPLSSLYCNTLLANLNVRTFIRSGLAMQHATSLPLMNSAMSDARASRGGQNSGHIKLMSPTYQNSQRSKLVTFVNADLSMISEDSV